MQPLEFQEAQKDFTNLCVTIANFPLRAFVESLEKSKEYRQHVPAAVLKKAERNMAVMSQLAKELYPIQAIIQDQIQRAQREGM